ncbi:MAG: putative Phosphomannomutase [Deltaproteobacteria bacterium]|nr:putative Phosphomannomutase [Deltaproteobacteria bacterium]
MTLDDLERGLKTVTVPEHYRRAAVQHLGVWWTGARYTAFRPQIESLAARGRWELLLDSFYRVLPFGTGGRRGAVGVGPNRINHDTILTSAQGHVHWLRRHFPTERLRVVIAFDVRIFRDLRRVYDPTVPNPLLNMHSRDFARLAAGVYTANAVDVYTVSGEDGFLLSTPELSFAIRDLRAHGGLNISASHNHPDDNGAKLYMPSGGQPVPPHDEEMARDVDAVREVRSEDFEQAIAAGRIRWWDRTCHERYLDENLSRSLDPTARRALVVFSPLHGTGLHTVGDLLPRAGFDLRLVEQQAAGDGEFPAVKFRIPNPEVPESMELLTAEAERLGADLGLATDPDADRLGVAAPHAGGWRLLSGNEIAIVLAAYSIETRREHGTLPPRAFMVKTAVTTELLTRIAKAHGVQMVGNLLVGFKYVGQVLDAINRDGRFGGVEATPADFLLAAEESNGVLVSPALRDKDAAGGALLLAELCARLRQRRQALGAYLDDVYRRYGYAANTAFSLVMEGIAGSQRVRQIMDRLRTDPPPALQDRSLQQTVDHWDEHQFGPFRSETERSARNFIQLRYDGGMHVAVRPSGTEPKIKFYGEQVFAPAVQWEGNGFEVARRAMDDASRELTHLFVKQVLRFVDIELPRPAFLVSSLVSLDNRIDFAAHFLPELEDRLRAGPTTDADRLSTWADERLKGYGRDPRFLVAAGVAEYFRERPLSTERKRLLRQLFGLA